MIGLHGITFDVTVAAAIWGLFTAVRAMIPARWWNIDGRWACWPLVFVCGLAVTVINLHAAYPADAAGWANVLLGALVNTVAAIVVDGAADQSGFKAFARWIVTIGGAINAVTPASASAASPASASAPVPAATAGTLVATAGTLPADSPPGTAAPGAAAQGGPAVGWQVGPPGG